MAKKAKELTPFMKKRLALIEETIGDGYNPMDVTVVLGGTPIRFSAQDLALYYSMKGGTFRVVTTAS